MLTKLVADADAAGDHEIAGLAEVGLGRVSNMLHDRAAAERWYAAASARATSHNLVRTPAFALMLRANDAWSRGDHREAARLWRESLPLVERMGAPDEEAYLYVALALTVPAEEATVLLERGLEIARRARSPRVEGVALLVLSDNAYNLGQWSKALAMVTEAMPLLDQNGTPIDRARGRVSLARLHRSHGNLEVARAEYRRAQTLLDASERGLGLSVVLTTLASGLNQLGQHEAGLTTARRAIEVARRNGNEVDETYAAFVAAEILLLLKRPADSLALIDGSPSVGPGRRSMLVRRAYVLSLLGRHAEALDVARAAEQTESFSREANPVNLAILADVRRRSGDAALALDNAQEAVTLLERLRENAMPTDNLRVGFDDGFQFVHGQLVRVLAEGGRHGEALAAAERARARAFLDLLASRDLSVDRTMAEAPSLGAIVSAAKRLGTTIVAYWTDRDGILAWVVTPNGLAQQSAVVMPSDRLATLVAQTWSPAEPVDPTGTRSSAFRELHDALVRPIEATLRKANTRRVTIVPHGSLFRLSFAGLQAGDGTFLIERAAVHYVPSVGALTALARTPEPTSRPAQGLVVSDPTLDSALQREEKLAPIPGAAAEGRAVARLLGVTPDRVLSSAAATERAVRSGLAGARVIHFATHAIVEDDRPMDSFLALAGKEAGADVDGRLTVEEVYGLSLDAGLVVLSGCRTASGRVTGDGVMGLSRAFFASGAPSVVASLWDLPDVAGQSILPAFYRVWSQHGDKARALRDAQLAMLRDLRAGRVAQQTAAGPITVPAHPAVWAGLVLMGAP